MDSKYANLPGIAHGEPDVYESSDLPESEQFRPEQPQLDTSTSVEITGLDVAGALEKFGRARLVAENADFSDRILPRRHRGYDQRNGDWELSDRESENVVQKFRRLKCEFEELVDELKRQRELDSGDLGDLPAKLLPEAEELHAQLNGINLEQMLGVERVATLTDPQGASKKKLMAGLEQLRQSKQLSTQGDSKKDSSSDHLTYEVFHLPERENFERLRRICEVDERLSRLEKLVGKPAATGTNPLNAEVSGLPLTSAVKVLASKMSLFEPAKLDMMEARAHSLLHKVHEISDRTASAGTQEKDNAKINELYSVLKSTEGVRGTLPDLVDRLMSLKEMHEQAGDCLRTTTEMDTVQKDIRAQIQLEHERLGNIEESVAKNVELMKANVEKLESRLAALKK